VYTTALAPKSNWNIHHFVTLLHQICIYGLKLLQFIFGIALIII
jgi:hypothetical protein